MLKIISGISPRRLMHLLFLRDGPPPHVACLLHPQSAGRRGLFFVLLLGGRRGTRQCWAAGGWAGGWCCCWKCALVGRGMIAPASLLLCKFKNE